MDDPKELLGNQSPPATPLTGSLNLFDINILPQRYRRRKIRLVAVLPWLIFVVLLGAIYPSGMMAMRAQTEYGLIRSEVIGLQATLENYQTAADEMAGLQAEIESQTERRDQILASYQGIELKGSRWSDTLFQIENSTPEGISYTQINQQDSRIFLEGIAVDYPTVLDLLDVLLKMDEFSNVQIDSIDQILADETAVMPAALSEDGQPLPAPAPSYAFTIIATIAKEGQP